MPRLFALLLLAACTERSPPCPLPVSGEIAPSAGCFAVVEGGLLMVQGLDGQVSLPGGSSRPGESARCTAFRETWEETGLRLQPDELLQVFDTGFHLYRCRRHAASGAIDPPRRMEVRAAFYLPPGQFDQYDWRFDEQRPQLRAMLEAATGAEP